MSNDLLYNDWRSVTDILGEERTAKLISNGTTLAVAMMICRFIQDKQLNKL